MLGLVQTTLCEPPSRVHSTRRTLSSRPSPAEAAASQGPAAASKLLELVFRRSSAAASIWSMVALAKSDITVAA